LKKKELLVPVGSMEHLMFAIHNGCDAVYLGGKRFGARAYASNFDDSQMIEAIRYCHLYGVKIYVTVNTMIYEREVASVLHYVGFLHQNHVDAVIVSDLGIIQEIHKMYPSLDIHVSTQAHTWSPSQMKFLKSIGATRVVIDRELSLEEIQALPDILEIEVFIHGALCVSVSGECLMSALEEVRSGNRGTCAQYCRMKYRALRNGKYLDSNGPFLLSTKELNTSHHIKELMNSNITSFKIEGRMKSKEYVGFITHFYRRFMDDKSMQVKKEEEKKLKTIFNRDFTDGYLFQNKNIMNFETANHLGYPIGSVIGYDSEKIKIKLTECIHQEDGIKFLPSDLGMIVNFLYNERGALVSSAQAGDIIFVDNKINLHGKDVVHKTIDKVLLKELQAFEEKKIPVSMTVNATLSLFTLTITDNEFCISVSKEICSPARSRSTTQEEIAKQLSKLGGTPFCKGNISIQVEPDLFIPVSQINEVRREAVHKLYESRCNR